ncbi:hypothetical protein AB0F72_08645 [Actinoplanes sp. NPDC023936]|uniref:hypothetical protein n=1 Tax=Actinoplanes sp. NPDC023936 TaxID=3154910 RepID=UPI0034116D24
MSFTKPRVLHANDVRVGDHMAFAESSPDAAIKWLFDERNASASDVRWTAVSAIDGYAILRFHFTNGSSRECRPGQAVVIRERVER